MSKLKKIAASRCVRFAPDRQPGDQWQRAAVAEPLAAGEEPDAVGVDREAEIIRGMICAQEGPFKSEGRGEFNRDGLTEIIRLIAAAPNGLKCRFTHPDLSNDGLGKFLGRVRNPRLDFLERRESWGQLKTDRIACVRADLHLDPSSHDTPNGDIGKYVLDLVESDSDAVSSSLVIEPQEEYRINPDGTEQRDAEGNYLPPLWHPIALHAVDIVDTGDAVDGLLSASRLDFDGLPDGVVRQAARLMQKQFAGKPRAFVRQRCLAWLDRYLDRTYGLEPETDGATPEAADTAGEPAAPIAAESGAEEKPETPPDPAGGEAREDDEAAADGGGPDAGPETIQPEQTEASAAYDPHRDAARRLRQYRQSILNGILTSDEIIANEKKS